ncbi:MAG: nickel pincer cofactor biosynthesis protein LarC [Nitrospirota bacterium]|nr:MAG: nickel pincer cofactor biosynthesis protein LarC [Nitrospirota bacterium]
MKIAYLDCSSGISGDMFTAALIDAGLPIEKLRKELSSLKVKGYDLKKRTVKRCGVKAVKFDVEVIKGKLRPRKLEDVKRIIASSGLDHDIKDKGIKLFEELFKAEAKVHGKRVSSVHLHELGAVDCLIDVVSALIGLKYLGIEKLFCSPVNVGGGTVVTEHGSLPIPAPATLELLKGTLFFSGDENFELTTPTGALLVSQLAEHNGGIPVMKLTGTGYGAGSRNLTNMPNLARIMVGESEKNRGDNTVYVIETNIDDMNPQYFHHVIERLFSAGALDVYTTPVIMKKQRPGVLMTALVEKEKLDTAVNIIFSETSTIGIRFTEWSRRTLQREHGVVQTGLGKVRVKKVITPDGTSRIYPEYDDCHRIAKKTARPIGEVIRDILEDIEN